MPTPSIESAVYTFEGLLPELESPPIAARRALDHAGFRLSVEGWRSLSADERQRVTLAGVPDRVDPELVYGLVRRATPPSQRITPVADPDPSAPPEALVKALEPQRTIDAKRWGRLRAVDRYALAHTYRRAVARSAFSMLADALDAVLVAGHEASTPPRAAPATSPPPPLSGAPGGSAYQPAGYYSSFVTPPDPRDAVPQRPPHETPTQPRVAVLGERPRGSYDDDDPPSSRSGPPAGRGFPSIPPPPGAVSTHLNQAGEMHMVDVGHKPETERRAVARGSVLMRPDTLSRLANRDAPKGEVLAAARVAAIMAAKRTPDLIPLCHTVALTRLAVVFDFDTRVIEGTSALHVTVTVDAYDRTGCEMEAMVAVSTACLTVYDMLKGIDRDMVIADVMLLEKSGGRNGHYQREEPKP